MGIKLKIKVTAFWSALLSKTQGLEGKVKVTRLCLTFCNPMDYTVHGVLQARILEWAAFPTSHWQTARWEDSDS